MWLLVVLILRLQAGLPTIFQSRTDGLNLSQEISRQILLVSPGDLRHEAEMSIPTRYLYEMVRDALSDHTLEAAARLYEIFIRNRCTRANASHMLEDT